MRPHLRAASFAVGIVALGASAVALAANGAQPVTGVWSLDGQSKTGGHYTGSVSVTESSGGKLDLTFNYTFDGSGQTVTLTGTGTRQGYKVDYTLPLETGMSERVGALGGNVGDPGKITGTMWLTTDNKLLWTHWTNSKDGSTGEEHLRRS